MNWILVMTILTSWTNHIEERETYRVFDSSEAAVIYLKVTEPGYDEYTRNTRYWELYKGYEIKRSTTHISVAYMESNRKVRQ